MRVLDHFARSPFSRRVRLALALKNLPVELREARETPAFRDEATRLYPVKTIPVLVDEDGTVVGDSSAIGLYLDAVAPEPRLWPREGRELARALEVATLVDGALDAIIGLGMRYHAVSGHEAWPSVKGEMLGRAQASLDRLGEIAARLGRPTIGPAWAGADIALFTAIAWFEGLPARAPTYAPAAQILALGWKVPAALTRYADAHRTRADVLALG